MLQPIPMDTGSFVEIRTANPRKLYVDKTAYFHRLITDPQVRRFFIARPRRFGKSLMISTLKAIFQGRRELFDGLAIDRTDYDWAVHPVIHINMGYCAAPDCAGFEESLAIEMERALGETGYAYEKDLLPADNLGKAVDFFAARGTPVVILIDEYDDPVARALADATAAEEIRTELACLYGRMKDRTEKIRFMMITGVSKFTKMSVFSAISNLFDLSFRDEYAAMLGYTEHEIDENFAEYTADHARKMGLTLPAYRAELQRLFNGYRFWKHKGEKVYNPVSINLNLALRDSEFELYWTKTGRPSMMMNFIKGGGILSIDPENVRNVSERTFDVTDLRNLHPIAMLYQTGYLTIRDYNPQAKTYVLGVPDEEVRQDLSLLMTSQIVGRDVDWAASIGSALLGGDWETFFEGLEALYAGATYGSTEGRVHESSYLRCLLFLLRGQGIVCQPEVVHAGGRTDLVADHPCGTFVFELKVDQPAALALTQAERRNYAAPYAAAGKPVWIIGLSFDSKTRLLAEHVLERLENT